MTDVVRQIITPIANQAAAIALSIPEGSTQPQVPFVAMATTDPTGGGASPTHCWGNGWIDSVIAARFEADPVNYVVTSFPNRQARQALLTHVPQLYEWIAPRP